MPGMAPISLQQFMNPTTGRPYAGARANFYDASAGTRITVYADYSLGTALPNPVVADAYGRFPPIFIDEATEFYRLRVTTSSGSVLPLGESGSFDIPVLPVIGPTAGEGGGSETPVDANGVLTTGDVIWVPKAGTRPGCIRLGGRTIGSASSGASERANADCEPLYEYAWTNFSNSICPVTGGRGISAASDFAANKPIAVLDMRRKGPFGLGDMGNSDLGFSGITFTVGDSTTAGASGGSITHTLTTPEIPSHTHTGTTASDGAHTHGLGRANRDNNGENPTGTATGAGSDTQTSSDGAHTHTFTTAATGGGGAHNNMPPFILGTWHWKL